jgi:hypothetical protein
MLWEEGKIMCKLKDDNHKSTTSDYDELLALCEAAPETPREGVSVAWCNAKDFYIAAWRAVPGLCKIAKRYEELIKKTDLERALSTLKPCDHCLGLGRITRPQVWPRCSYCDGLGYVKATAPNDEE